MNNDPLRRLRIWLVRCRRHAQAPPASEVGDMLSPENLEIREPRGRGSRGERNGLHEGPFSTRPPRGCAILSNRSPGPQSNNIFPPSDNETGMFLTGRSNFVR